MLENRIITNGSAYLAEPYSPTGEGGWPIYVQKMFYAAPMGDYLSFMSHSAKRFDFGHRSRWIPSYLPA